MGKLPVILALLILLIVGLYVVTVVVGADGGVGGCSPSRDSKDEWRAKLRPPAVKKTEMRLDGCERVGERLRFASAGCTISVAKIDPSSLSLGTSRGLRLGADTPFNFRFQPLPRGGDDSVAVESGPDGVKVGKLVDLTVPKDGGQVTLACPDPKNPCFVRVE